MVCGGHQECAEILIWVAVAPDVQLRALACQSCWARTLRKFTKDATEVENKEATSAQAGNTGWGAKEAQVGGPGVVDK